MSIPADPGCESTPCDSGADCQPNEMCFGVFGEDPTCVCEPRFTGPACDECAPGHTGDDCLECLPGYHVEHFTLGEDWLDPDSPVEMEPGDFVCVPDVGDEFCSMTPEDGGLECGAHGTCVEVGPGDVACSCDEHWGSATCDRCEPGFEVDDYGNCVLGEACSEWACHGNGSCVEDGAGMIACACDDGYEHPDCGDDAIEVVFPQRTVTTGEHLLLIAGPRNGEDPGNRYLMSIAEGPGELHQCPATVLDDNDQVVASCTEPNRAIFYVREPVAGFSESRLDLVVQPPDGSTPFNIDGGAVYTVPEGWLPMTGSMRIQFAGLYDEINKLMQARGVRGGVLAVNMEGQRMTEVGIGYKDLGLGPEPWHITANKPDQDVLRHQVRPDTPYRLASVSKPVIAGAVRARLHYLAEHPDEIPAWLQGEFDMDDPLATPVLPLLEHALQDSPEHPVGRFSYNRDLDDPNSRWYDITIGDLIHHSAGFCRGNKGESEKRVYGEYPGESGACTPEDQPCIEGNADQKPYLADWHPDGPVPATNESAVLTPDETVFSWDLGVHDGLGGAAHRIKAMNDVMAFRELDPDGDEISTPSSCSTHEDGLCHDYWTVTNFMLGIEPIYEPGSPYGSQCPGVSDGMATFETKGTGGVNTGASHSSYSNFGYMTLGLVLVGLHDEQWTYEGESLADGWGPIPGLLHEFLAEFGIGDHDIYVQREWDPHGFDAQANEYFYDLYAPEPCYRELKPDTGLERESWNLEHPERYRYDKATATWGFCNQENIFSCPWAVANWTKDPNSRQTTRGQAFHYGTGGGMVGTAPALLRFAAEHVISGGRLPAVMPEAEASYWNGELDSRIPEERLPGRKTGGFSGTRTYLERFLPDSLEWELPVYGSEADSAWKLEGPDVGVKEKEDFALPTYTMGMCETAGSYEVGFFVADGIDPADAALSGSLFTRRRREAVEYGLCAFEEEATSLEFKTLPLVPPPGPKNEQRFPGYGGVLALPGPIECVEHEGDYEP